jgi:hypothetical protein
MIVALRVECERAVDLLGVDGLLQDGRRFSETSCGSSEMNGYEPWPVERGFGSAASLRARGRWARRSVARCKSSVAI